MRGARRRSGGPCRGGAAVEAKPTGSGLSFSITARMDSQ
jgi:hypothetical protein